MEQNTPEPRAQLAFPPDAETVQTISKLLDTLLTQKLFDVIWKNLFHWWTYFESINTTNSGFTVTIDASGSLTNDGTGVTMTTDVNNGNSVDIQKLPTEFGLATFNQRSNLRSSFKVSSISNITGYIITGPLGSNDYYGFKVVNSVLYGVSKDGTTENTIALKTIAASTVYTIEARYQPSRIILFYVNNQLLGNLVAHLPRPVVGGAVAVNNTILEIKVTTNTTLAKTMNVSFFEYLQTQNTNN